ncbi:hypothetical protein C0992_003399 [Termitomyces sp. T32_za158]|nr:hypothetical protein C0992_003399 [Termitomyces sp. T32_za158]
MLSNILRTQARLALTTFRARIPVSSVSRVATRFPTVSSFSRAISTSRLVYNDGFVSPTTGNTESQTIFIGNLPFSVSEDDIRERFLPFGAIQDVRIAYHPDGRSRGFAHVEFADLHDAIAAHKSIKEEPMYILDRDVRVDYAAARNQTLVPSGALYFHGFRGTLNDLRNVSSDLADNIVNIVFLKNRETGQETGAGFIHFTDIPSAEEGLKRLNGRQFEDDVIRVRFAAPRKPQQQRRRSSEE